MKKLFILLCFLLPLALVSQTSTSSDGTWSTGANWSSGVPAKDETATITNDMDLDTDLEVDDGNFNVNNGTITDDGGGYNILVQGTGVLDVGGNVTINGDLTLKNFADLFIRSGDTLRIGGSVVIENHADWTIEAGGVLIIDGDLEMKNLTDGDIDGKVSVGGDLTGSNHASIIGDGNIEVDGTVDLANSSTLFGSGSDCDPGPCEYGSGEGLPIELIDFEARFIDEYTIELNWSTASEINNDYFIIEASEDGKSFYKVQQLNGAGNSNSTKNYRILHEVSPSISAMYYRLTQVDFDGQREAFPLVIAKRNIEAQANNDATIKLYPNPSNGSMVFVELNAFNTGQYMLDLIDSRGKHYYQVQLQLDEYKNVKLQLPNTDQYPKGVYHLRVIGQRETFTKSLVLF